MWGKQSWYTLRTSYRQYVLAKITCGFHCQSASIGDEINLLLLRVLEPPSPSSSQVTLLKLSTKQRNIFYLTLTPHPLVYLIPFLSEYIPPVTDTAWPNTLEKLCNIQNIALLSKFTSTSWLTAKSLQAHCSTSHCVTKPRKCGLSVDKVPYGAIAFNISSITMTYVEPAKCMLLMWVVHVACVTEKIDIVGFSLGSLKGRVTAWKTSSWIRW
jgi:hypothetical protein